MTELLHIERLSCEYRVARDHPLPESVRSRLDEVAAEQVGRQCAVLLRRMFDPADPSVWVIDRLDVQLTLDIGAADTSQVAALWANRIAGTLGRTVAAGPDETAGVRRFPNRAEYLAWLLGLLLAGRPWTSLHNREFEGLRAMPLTGLISEALVREPAVASTVVDALVRNGLFDRLIRTLTPVSSLRILHVCAPEPDDGSLDRELWRAALAVSAGTTNPLEIYLRLRMEDPALPAATARSAAERCLEFRLAMASGEVREAMQAGRFSQALKAAPPELRPALLLQYTLAAGDRHWLQEAAFDAAAKDLAAPEALESAFAGVFLLLPDLLALYPESPPLFRFVVLLKCFGRDLAPAAWRDPAFTIASGLEEAPAADQIALCRCPFDVPSALEDDLAHFSLDRILNTSEPDDSCSRAAHALMRRFARRFLNLDRSSAPYLVRNILAGGGHIHQTPGRILVRLASRPLQIVLRMAGIHGLTVQSGETEIAIELADD